MELQWFSPGKAAESSTAGSNLTNCEWRVKPFHSQLSRLVGPFGGSSVHLLFG
jgi:hypothetical protein